MAKKVQKKSNRLKSTKPRLRSKKSAQPCIGFIGQGFIGKNYADDFERRGFPVVRYALEPQYVGNKEKITECDIVFIAVPTPTTPEGFDDSIIRSALKHVGAGKIAVVKSTVLPGSTKAFSKERPDIFVLHSPEFLTERNAAHDAAHPNRNIIGIPEDSALYRAKAKSVLAVLPKAPFERVMGSDEAELVKYAGNGLLYIKTVFVNILYDVAQSVGADWSNITAAIAADPRLGSSHLQVVHSSGRGAGGHCFIKDFSAFKRFFEEHVKDAWGSDMLSAIEAKNLNLLASSGKDEALVNGVYGTEAFNLHAKNK